MDLFDLPQRDHDARARQDLDFLLGLGGPSAPHGASTTSRAKEAWDFEDVEEVPESDNPLTRLVEQVLEKGARRGDVALYWENLLREVCEAAKLEDGLPVDDVMAANPERFVREHLGGQDLVYLRNNHHLERLVAFHVRRLQGGKLPWRIVDAQSSIDRSESAQGLTLSPSQRAALLAVLGAKFTVITGGPGTGKTTMTNVLLHVLESVGVKITLAAPTGRAARRMSEATGLDASTIHRLLGQNKAKETVDPEVMLDTQLVVIDEASMLDVELTARLLSHLPAQCGVVLIGDTNQLPSVGPGQVLEDLIGSGLVPCPKLTDVHRQAADSGIVLNATRIIDGTSPATEADKVDFVVLDSPSDKETLARLRHLASDLIPKKMKLNPLRDIQVLAPMRMGLLGTDNLNLVLQNSLNQEPRSTWTTFRSGDRVMQTSNDYDRKVFNGDIGFIAWVNDDAKTLRVEFGRNPVVYKRSEIGQLKLAYAITVHKSQGSEFPVCLVPLARNGGGGLTRRLLYTAVTRGKKKVIVIGHAEAVTRSVTNSRDEARISGLLHRLRNSY